MDYPEDLIIYYSKRYDVVVAAGMPSWPNFVEFDDEAIALPNVGSNIECGTGFVGGIVSDTLNIVDTCTRVSINNL